MAKDNKFLALLETYESRYNQQGFLVGDVFKFNDDFKSHDRYKDLPDNVRAVIDSMIDSGLHIRVSQINADLGDVVVASDYGGGRLVGKIRIPSALGQPVDFGVNLPPIADVQKHAGKVTIKPEEVPKLPAHSNSAGALEEDEEVEAVVAESAEDSAEIKVTYTQQYL
jgi:hypothetical protein